LILRKKIPIGIGIPRDRDVAGRNLIADRLPPKYILYVLYQFRCGLLAMTRTGVIPFRVAGHPPWMNSQ